MNTLAFYFGDKQVGTIERHADDDGAVNLRASGIGMLILEYGLEAFDASGTRVEKGNAADAVAQSAFLDGVERAVNGDADGARYFRVRRLSDGEN